MLNKIFFINHYSEITVEPFIYDDSFEVLPFMIRKVGHLFDQYQ